MPFSANSRRTDARRWRLALAVVVSACSPLSPSGGREPEPSAEVDRDVPESPGTDPKPPKVEAPASALPIVLTVKSSAGQFAQRISPRLTASCTAGGCHSAPEVIDLRSFPFAAAGSYAMDDILRRLGETPDPHEVQKQLVATLIDSMRTVYMPPAPATPVDEAGLADFERWLADDLDMGAKTFEGRLSVNGYDDLGQVVCSMSAEVVGGTYRGSMERASCNALVRVAFSVHDSSSTPVAEGTLDADAFLELATWVIEVEPPIPPP